jgi:hypothetical protein
MRSRITTELRISWFGPSRNKMPLESIGRRKDSGFQSTAFCERSKSQGAATRRRFHSAAAHVHRCARRGSAMPEEIDELRARSMEKAPAPRTTRKATIASTSR